MSNENATFNMDALLEGSLDDLADMPEFKPYPAGSYKVLTSLSQKKIGDHPAVEIKMVLLEVLELANAGDTAPEPKAECTASYMMDSEFGQGAFKKIMKSAGTHFNLNKVSDIIAALQNAECLVITKVRQNKEKTQNYADIVELAVV